MRRMGTFALGLCLSVACLRSAIGADAPKVGVVDVNKVLQDYSATKVLLKEFQGQVAEYKAKLEVSEKEIDGKRSRLQEQALILTDEERSKQEQEIKGMEEEKEKQITKMNTDLAPTKRLLQKTVDETLEEKIKPAIKVLGDREGYTLILLVPNDGVLYYAEPIDLTSQILAELEKTG